MTWSWSKTCSRVRRSGAGTGDGGRGTGDGGLRAGYGSGEGRSGCDCLQHEARCHLGPDLLCPPPRVVNVVHVFRVRLVRKSEHDMWESFLNYPLSTVRILR